MAVGVTSRRVNTVAGNMRFRIIRGVADSANDTLVAGAGRVIFAKPTVVNGNDLNVGVARNSATPGLDNPALLGQLSLHIPGSVAYIGLVPTTTTYAHAVIGVG